MEASLSSFYNRFGVSKYENSIKSLVGFCYYFFIYNSALLKSDKKRFSPNESEGIGVLLCFPLPWNKTLKTVTNSTSHFIRGNVFPFFVYNGFRSLAPNIFHQYSPVFRDRNLQKSVLINSAWFTTGSNRVWRVKRRIESIYSNPPRPPTRATLSFPSSTPEWSLGENCNACKSSRAIVQSGGGLERPVDERPFKLTKFKKTPNQVIAATQAPRGVSNSLIAIISQDTNRNSWFPVSHDRNVRLAYSIRSFSARRNIPNSVPVKLSNFPSCLAAKTIP